MNFKSKKRYVGPAIGVAGLALLIFIMGLWGKKDQEKHDISMKSALEQYIAGEVGAGVFRTFMPMFSFAGSNGADSIQRVVYSQVEELVPLFCIKNQSQDVSVSGTEEMTMEMVMKAEAREETHAGDENRPMENEGADKDTWGESLEALFQAENQAARGQLEVKTQQESVPSKENVISTGTAFVPRTTKLEMVDMTALADYETLLQTFYTVDKSTMAGSELLNAEKLASVDMKVSKEAEGPQILIYHTHSQEAFADSVPGDSSTTIVGVGERLAQILSETYGYQVLHHTASYDLPSRDDAYSVALPEIEKILEENPQIQVVIDLHRDAMDESTHLVTEIDGRPTARFMFFNGLSRTRKTGNISYLYNENLEENLAFSFQMQKSALEYYPGLTRKVYLKAYRYNMHLRPKNLLIELGAQNNTVEEAMNACDPLAHILDMVLSGQG